ncbi:MAG: hypothetical protein F6K28_16355 [Microcoleus sp. SIO2G3]|nr:hypothetical protein [Microcoleus sp. SIO2G3]
MSAASEVIPADVLPPSHAFIQSFTHSCSLPAGVQAIHIAVPGRSLAVMVCDRLRKSI